MYINLAFDFASSHAFTGSRCGLSFIMFSLILFANGFSIVCHLNFSSSCFLCKIVTSFAMFTLFLVLVLIVDWRHSIDLIHLYRSVRLFGLHAFTTTTDKAWHYSSFCLYISFVC